VQAQVADRAGHPLAELDRRLRERLVDVAEGEAQLAHAAQVRLLDPGAVAHLEDERVFRERLADAGEADEARFARVEEERELAEQRPEPARLAQRRETGAKVVAIGERPRLRVVVGEAPGELRGEAESRAVAQALEPLLGGARLQRPVEGRVDLDQVEEARDGREALGAGALRVDDPLPVVVGEAGGPDEEARRAHATSSPAARSAASMWRSTSRQSSARALSGRRARSQRRRGDDADARETTGP
jgi:hypothetical protein